MNRFSSDASTMKPRIAAKPVSPIACRPSAPADGEPTPTPVQLNSAMNWPSMNASTMKPDMSLMPRPITSGTSAACSACRRAKP